MSWMNEVGMLLEKYATSTGTPDGLDVENHFGQVAKSAPQAQLSSGITEAFRSESTAPFSEMVSSLFGHSSPAQKSGLLNTLLGSLGPSALGVLTNLGLGDGTAENPITADQAQSVDPSKVQEIAAAAEKNDPSVMDRAGEFYAQHPTLVRNLGSAALAIVLGKMARNTRAM